MDLKQKSSGSDDSRGTGGGATRRPRRHAYRGYGSPLARGARFGGAVHWGGGFAGVGTFEPGGGGILPRAEIFSYEPVEPAGGREAAAPAPGSKALSGKSRSIPLGEWPRFFDEFARSHEGWLVTVRILDPKLGAQVAALDLPFEGIVADSLAPGQISLYLGRPATANLEHQVDEAVRVWLAVAENGTEEAIEIESRDGTKTVVELRRAAQPVTVNGILEP